MRALLAVDSAEQRQLHTALVQRGWRVSTAGTFRLHARQPFLSHALQNEYIGLEEVADGIWNIVYYSTLLGKIDERSLLITGV